MMKQLFYTLVMDKLRMYRINRDEKEAMPFFIIVAGVMIFLYGITIYTRKDLQLFPSVVVFSVVMGIHTTIHWFFWIFSRLKQSALIYFYIQTALALFLVYYTKELSLVFGLFLPLLGEEVGLFRSKRAVLISIFSNSVLIIVSLLFYFNSEGFDPLIFIGIFPLVFFVIIYVNLYNRQSDAKLRAESLLKELETSRAMVEQLTIEQERQRMARELHDSLAQGLSGLILQLEAVSVHIEQRNNEKAAEIVNAAMSIAREALSGAREAIDGLRNDFVAGDRSVSHNSSLSEFIESKSELFNDQSMRFSCKISVKPVLNASQQDHLKRIITEALTNCLIHSKAQNVNITLSGQTEDGLHVKNELVLCISDDGEGFDTENILDGHYGITGIYERCGIIGAGFNIKSTHGVGTIMTIRIPESRGLNG